MMSGPVDVMTEEARWKAPDLDLLANRAARAVLSHLGLDPERCEISCLGCNDKRIADLNADFLGKPQATNVLSWPSEERGAARAGQRPALPRSTGGTIELGDIAIAWETCAAEAEAEHLPLADHALHLLVHAMLHLLGFDHERDADAALMERLETEILGTIGVADPYGRDHMSPAADGPASRQSER